MRKNAEKIDVNFRRTGTLTSGYPLALKSPYLGKQAPFSTVFEAIEREKPIAISCIYCFCITRVTGSLAIVFARLQIQYGAGNCKKGY